MSENALNIALVTITLEIADPSTKDRFKYFPKVTDWVESRSLTRLSGSYQTLSNI